MVSSTHHYLILIPTQSCSHILTSRPCPMLVACLHCLAFEGTHRPLLSPPLSRAACVFTRIPSLVCSPLLLFRSPHHQSPPKAIKPIKQGKQARQTRKEEGKGAFSLLACKAKQPNQKRKISFVACLLCLSFCSTVVCLVALPKLACVRVRV